MPFLQGRTFYTSLQDLFERKVRRLEILYRQESSLFGCLRKGHSSKGCKHRSTCATCQKRHPSLLHGDLPSTPSPKSEGGTIKNNHKEVPPEGNEIVPSSVSHHTNIGEGESTSMIVPVWVSAVGQPNQKVLEYALLNTQSDTSFVLVDTSAALSAQKTPVQLKLSTMTSTECVLRCNAVRGIQVCGFSSHTYVSISCAYTKDYIPVEKMHIPTSETVMAWQHFQCIASELQPLQNCEVGLLIGYDTPQALIPREAVVGSNSEPYGAKTDLGWSIVGCTPRFDKVSGIVHCTSAKESPSISPKEVLKLLESDLTDTGDEILVSQDDMQFVYIMERRICHKTDGHYGMPPPFKSRPSLPNNCKLAEICLDHLKRKLAANLEYRQHYVGFMEEMLKRGDAEAVSSQGMNGEVWYIPHHGVYHTKQPKKIRVVFDCYARFKGSSLNEHLLIGPDMTNELIGVLMHFRKHSITIMCDVERMFHQFHVSEPDRNYLRFYGGRTGI